MKHEPMRTNGQKTAAMPCSSWALVMAISAPIWGIVADRYGRKPMVLRAMFAGAIPIAASQHMDWRSLIGIIAYGNDRRERRR